jgi:hypothetical protein
MPEELVDEEITADMLVDAPVEMGTETAEISESLLSTDAFSLAEQTCAPVDSEPEIEVAGEIVAIGAGQYRLLLLSGLETRKSRQHCPLTFPSRNRSCRSFPGVTHIAPR